MSKLSSNKFTHNTEDWELHACLDWQRKWHIVECDQCHGSGVQPRGLRDSYYGDDTTCSRCFGKGAREVQSTSPKPPIPSALIEHMRRAWWDYHNPKDMTVGSSIV